MYNRTAEAGKKLGKEIVTDCGYYVAYVCAPLIAAHRVVETGAAIAKFVGAVTQDTIDETKSRVATVKASRKRKKDALNCNYGCGTWVDDESVIKIVDELEDRGVDYGETV